MRYLHVHVKECCIMGRGGRLGSLCSKSFLKTKFGQTDRFFFWGGGREKDNKFLSIKKMQGKNIVLHEENQVYSTIKGHRNSEGGIFSILKFLWLKKSYFFHFQCSTSSIKIYIFMKYCGEMLINCFLIWLRLHQKHLEPLSIHDPSEIRAILKLLLPQASMDFVASPIILKTLFNPFSTGTGWTLYKV